jgi:hypothetical protein
MARQARHYVIPLLAILISLELVYLGYSFRNELWLKGDNIPGSGDAPFYLAEIERIRSGEGFYQAAADELTANSYPMRSVFNWRTPLPMWLIGHLPANGWGRGLMIFLCLLLSVMTFHAVYNLHINEMPKKQTVILSMATVLLLWGPLSLAVWNFHYTMPIYWAGIFVALSCCAYGLGRPGWGVGCGLAAIFFRELAIPYVLTAMAIAAWNRQRRELLFWLVGLSAWAAFYAYHAWRVLALIPDNASSQPNSYIQFGGLKFALSAFQMNYYLLVIPLWCTAVFVLLCLAGLLRHGNPFTRRLALSIGIYLVFFSIVGQEFNAYWGFLATPIACLGFARFFLILRPRRIPAFSP